MSDDATKPANCPFCGDDAVALSTEHSGSFVYCANWQGCNARGPRREAVPDAVEAWNEAAQAVTYQRQRKANRERYNLAILEAVLNNA